MKQMRIFLCSLFLLIFSLQAAAAGAAPRTAKKEKASPARFARVAILPVINLQEDIDYANTIVFQKALEAFTYPDYEIYDSERLYKALEEIDYYESGKAGVTEAMLRTIMEKAGLDMIVMVKLNELVQESYPYGREAQEEITLDMDVMAIFDWREKIVNTHIRDKKTAEYAVIMKIDWKLREYSNAVSIQLDRIAKLGKK
ncbi:MAG: hypothetical protein LBP78_04830 [Acidaminococcales bacterium]|jgi:hypothetical protein|nr:hypothetical protein [Acidaminococcales bacterium]